MPPRRFGPHRDGHARAVPNPIGMPGLDFEVVFPRTRHGVDGNHCA